MSAWPTDPAYWRMADEFKAAETALRVKVDAYCRCKIRSDELIEAIKRHEWHLVGAVDRYRARVNGEETPAR